MLPLPPQVPVVVVGRDRSDTTTTQTPDALRAAIVTSPKSRSPCLHLELLRDLPQKTGIDFYLFLILVLAHVTFLFWRSSTSMLFKS